MQRGKVSRFHGRVAWALLVLTAVCVAGGAAAEPQKALLPPNVVSITRDGPSPTAAPEVVFVVLFDEPVTGVDLEDFELEAHNLVGEAMLSVTGSGTTYDVLVDSGEGAGVIEVHLRDNDTIRDLDSNALGGPGPGNGDHDCDEMYVVDRRGPEITLTVDNPLVIECGGGVFTYPDATATDTTYGDVTADIQVTGTVDPDAVNDYEVTYTVSDPLGNTTELVLAVQVRDTTLPGIVLLGDNPQEWPCDAPYADPGASVTDTCGDVPELVIDAGDVDPSQAGTYTVYFTAADASGNVRQETRTVVVLAPCGEGEEPAAHTADQDGNGLIELSELLRVIQFYNSGGFHCADDPGSTEDGYVPGAGANHACTPHASDYDGGASWTITLTELLRLIQFYNSGGYHACPGEGTEDGYCPGLA